MERDLFNAIYFRKNAEKKLRLGLFKNTDVQHKNKHNSFLNQN
jgi:hypothetical protein